jgi:hypothetical protein
VGADANGLFCSRNYMRITKECFCSDVPGMDDKTPADSIIAGSGKWRFIMKNCKIWIPVGALGAPFPDESITYAISQKVDAIALDAGSTDSGPYYLGSGTSTKPKEAIKVDLRRLMKARQELGVPLIIASCGTCGTNGMVDWTRDMCLEIAQEENFKFKLALIYSEQDKEYLKKRLREGRIKALPNAPPISEEVIESCTHIVGVMGTEPIIDALENGADIVWAAGQRIPLSLRRYR